LCLCSGCDDDNECTIDLCDTDSGCYYTENGCVNSPISCVDTIGCINTPIDCDDGNLCTLDWCGETGSCNHDFVKFKT